MLIARGALLIPEDATELRRELLMLRVNLTPSGTERIDAAIGHDDLADALAFACGPYQRDGDAQWRSWLADLADPASKVPAPAHPVARVEALPRVPVVQSIAGRELTDATGLEPTRHPSAVNHRASHPSLTRGPSRGATCPHLLTTRRS